MRRARRTALILTLATVAQVGWLPLMASAASEPPGFSTHCPATVAFGETDSPAACIGYAGTHLGDHAMVIQTSQYGTGALAVYDYLGNPSSVLSTLGASLSTFGRTAPGTNDGDSVDAFGSWRGNSDVFHPNARDESNGTRIANGPVTLCPAGTDLVTTGAQAGCQTLTRADIAYLHSLENAGLTASLLKRAVNYVLAHGG